LRDNYLLYVKLIINGFFQNDFNPASGTLVTIARRTWEQPPCFEILIFPEFMLTQEAKEAHLNERTL